MNSTSDVVNVVLAGLGGQGIVKASDILADAAYRAGFDVKKSEIHGMSQRGGSVSSDVRYGARVWSPMIPVGEADVLVVVDSSQVGPNQHMLRPDGALITPDMLTYLEDDEDDDSPEAVMARRTVNVALLGALSARIEIPETSWVDAIRENLSSRLHEFNIEAFYRGRGLA